MNSNDQEKFFEMWQAVREDIYSRKVSPAALGLIFDSLSRFSIEDVERGIKLHINDTQNGQFPITPTHVIANIEGRADERGAVAWRKFMDAVTNVSVYDDVCFDDAGIHAIIENEGGWARVCGFNEDDMKFFQNRFVKQYSALVSKRQFDYPKVLKGIANVANKGVKYEDGSDVPMLPPVVVGSKEQARQVYLGGSNNKIQISQNYEVSEAVSGLLVNNSEAK